MKTLRVLRSLALLSLGSFLVPSHASAQTSAPVITVQPTSLSVASGAFASFTVVATGAPTLLYQWSRNGAVVGSMSQPTLTLPAVTTADAGSYTVTISNAAGTVTSAVALLTVNPPEASAPVITTQPLSQNVPVGTPVTFTVAATGSGTLTYSWSKEGRMVSLGSAASFTIAAAAMADAGTYRVMVSSVGGTTTSSDAILTVVGNTPLPPPR